MREIRTEGIILSANWLRERELLLRIFTPSEGVLLCSFYPKPSSLPSPLSRVEVLLKQKQEGFFRCQELLSISSYLALRKDFSLLQAASRLLRSIEVSQCKHHPSPHLYQLLVGYLEHMVAGISHETLSASFLLKLLKHEGVWDPFSLGIAKDFSEQEVDILFFLTEVKSYQQLQLLSLPMELQKKIHQLFSWTFDDCLEN